MSNPVDFTITKYSGQHGIRPVYNYVFCIVSTYLGFKIRSTDR